MIHAFVKGISGRIPGGSDTQFQFNDGGVFGGASGLLYDKATNTVRFPIGINDNAVTPLLSIDIGARKLYASDGVTLGLDYSTLYAISGAGGGTPVAYSNFFGPLAGYLATNASWSNFFCDGAGAGATYASYSNFFGALAGVNAVNATRSNFFGPSAGNGATYASYSNFFGIDTGAGATNAIYSNFFGPYTGNGATGAFWSNFFGPYAGFGATHASYSNFFGPHTGYQATYASYSNFFGKNTGRNATYAKNCIFVGPFSGYNDTVNNSNGAILTFSIDTAGSGYLTNEQLTITGGSGTAKIKVTVDGPIGGLLTVSAGSSAGTGYAEGDTVYVTGGNNQGSIYITEVGGNGEIIAWEDDKPGLGYTTGTDFPTTTDGNGEGFLIDIDSVAIGAVTGGILIFAGESDYTVSALNATSGGTGTGCTVEITSVTTGTLNGTSIAIGRYSGTGGFSDSVAIGHGVINSAQFEMNLGNVMKLTGIYASDSQSSAFLPGGKVGIGITPTARLTLPAGTAVAGTAQLKITAGINLTTPEAGAIESDGTHIYWTDSGGIRRQLDN